MSLLFPTNGEYIIAGLLFAAYLALRLNVLPRVGGRLNSEILLLCFFCGAVLLNLSVYHSWTRDLVDPVGRTEGSLRELSRLIPEGARVGYISEITPSDGGASLERDFLTQYALAPRIVDRGTSQDWAIVNDPAYDPRSAPDGMILVRDFGAGLMLFRRGDK